MSRLQQARRAYERGDVEQARQAHDTQRIRTSAVEPHQQEQGRYLAEMVYGASDGIVTTFAVVAGVTGAALSPGVVLVLGLANLLGDGFSMAAGAYLSGRSQQDYERKEREREAWEIDHFPEGEREEIREIYRAKGFEGEALEYAVRTITSDRERWIETMMREELHILPERKDPLHAALATFVAFAIGGAVPLLAFVLAGLWEGLRARSFEVAVVLTLLTMFGVGSARSLVTYKPWYRAGLEMLLVGGLAAAIAYAVGYFLGGLA
ncbi:MAG: VIT1/CCC1 transporter family protein [Limnochordaceae bacterium]|uniref:VIT1/CCC1 transporter family protein n=1 Tax=Carboxydichorda subterranea TaxID=3109565 RepID=A0ABZ1BTH0_9FIRM|nr:VIT1/CCC1 transporter family protein [Limnochorda sp. L945t]MBE3598623.1 VIT1/CCC1 transporter family protein [Limnochordaceae bacterium]WRP16082.1 VIT1/CCC1 transporter family protein [Limnochorda sp. L945t]